MKQKRKIENATIPDKLCPLTHDGECLGPGCKFSMRVEGASGCVFTLLIAYLANWLRGEKQDAFWEATVEGDSDGWLRRLGLRKAGSDAVGEATG